MLFCWRCGAPRSELIGPCNSCGRACPRVRHDRWNQSLQDPWLLSVGGEEFRGLNHAAMMWYVSRAAIERGISPEELRRHFTNNSPQRWMAISGQMTLDEFRLRAAGIVRDLERYQAEDDDDLFYFGGQVWALTNQLGANTGEYARSIGAAYPQLDFTLRP